MIEYDLERAHEIARLEVQIDAAQRQGQLMREIRDARARQVQALEALNAAQDARLQALKALAEAEDAVFARWDDLNQACRAVAVLFAPDEPGGAN